MTKKGYQKGLPKVLAPPVPRPPASARPTVPTPRASPEPVERRPTAATTAPAAPPTVPAAPPTVPAAPPTVSTAPAPTPTVPTPTVPTPTVPTPTVPTSGGRSRAVVGLVAAGVATLLVAGLIGYLVVGAVQEDGGSTLRPESTAGAAPPRPLTTDESYVEAVVRPDGQVVVHQWIRSGEPLRRLRLALPTVPGAESLSAAGVEVVADGLPVAGPDRITDRAATYFFPGTTNVQLTYRLLGAVERSDSAPGRALAIATTLDVGYSPRTERETRVVRAPEVLTLACSTTPDESPTPCGEHDGDGQWRVELAGPQVADRVIAQLTLG